MREVEKLQSFVFINKIYVEKKKKEIKKFWRYQVFCCCQGKVIEVFRVNKVIFIKLYFLIIFILLEWVF